MLIHSHSMGGEGPRQAGWGRRDYGDHSPALPSVLASAQVPCTTLRLGLSQNTAQGPCHVVLLVGASPERVHT